MSLMAGAAVYTGDRRKHRLGPLLKSGGAGSVYPLLDSPTQVAKIYHDSVDHAEHERKVAAMLYLSPNLPDLIDRGLRHAQIAWPQSLLRDERGRFVGFLMPAIDVQSTSELECILQERQARAMGLPTGLGAKVTLAANLAAVIAELHRQGHHVVDLKPVNVRFYRQTLYMAILDCDGFSIQGQGERFPAQQVTPDYLAPEFQSQPIAPAQEEQQDRFALAVVIFQLLNFGIHPFTGRPSNERVSTDIPGRIAQRCYAYGLRANPNLSPAPASGHQALPADLRALCDRAFEGTGAARPSAAEWASTLAPYAQRSNQRVVVCARDRQHQHFAGLPCAACARVALIANTRRDAEAARSIASKRAVSVAKATSRAPLPGGTRAPPPVPQRPITPAQLAQLVPGMMGRMSLPYGFQRQHANLQASAFNAVMARRVIALLAILGFLVFLFPPPDRESRAPAPPAAVVEPPPRPPPAALRDDLIADRAAIQSVLDTMLAGDTAGMRAGLANLRALAMEHPSAPLEAYAEPFARFAANPGSNSDSDRLPLVGALEAEYARDHHNSRAAYALGWLALHGANRAGAGTWFVRSIGDDPDRAEAWYGLGVASTGDGDAIGAFAVAEMLRPSTTDADTMRAAFPQELVLRAGVEPHRMAVLEAKARVIAARLTHRALPADIAALARQDLSTR